MSIGNRAIRPRQVSATLPFQLVSSMSFTFIVYGMAGLRNTVACIFSHGLMTTLLSLIAVQARAKEGASGAL